MQLKKLLIFLIFSFFISDCFGQVSDKEREKLNAVLNNNILPFNFPDSTALYTCQIQITIDPAKNYAPLVFSTDTAVTNRLKGLELINNYNYKLLVVEKKIVRFIIPIAITTISKKDRSNPMINAIAFSRKMGQLYYDRKGSAQNLIVDYLTPVLLLESNVEW